MSKLGLMCNQRRTALWAYKGSHQDLFPQTDLTESNASVNLLFMMTVQVRAQLMTKT